MLTANKPRIGWPLALLTVWACFLHAWLYRHGGYSWHFFADGAAVLLGHNPPGMEAPGGLHLYANYPQLQFGPVALLAAAALQSLGAANAWLAAAVFMSACGLIVLRLLYTIATALHPWQHPHPRRLRATMLVGGGLFLLSWEQLSVHFGHLDDVLALVFLTGAAACVALRSPMAAALCVGLAVDAKPWALACAALLLSFPAPTRWRALLVAAGTIAVAWLPFILADPHTLFAAKFTILNVPASALRAMGVTDPSTPSWDRMAQFGAGCLLGAVAVLRRRWIAVITLGIAARLALDPSVYTYYTAGLALGVLLWDLNGFRKPVPLLSLMSFGGITVVIFVLRDPNLLGQLRLWTLLALSAIVLAAPAARPRSGRRQRDALRADLDEAFTAPIPKVPRSSTVGRHRAAA